jgi:hypothetical protein
MAIILEERGFEGCQGRKGKRAECEGFKCAPGAIDCCCRRALYNEPDFVNVESLLEIKCRARGFHVIFLPKFHCELNFIEQCWVSQSASIENFRHHQKKMTLSVMLWQL